MTKNAAVILAAGKGKRMGGVFPKVLFNLNNRSLIDRVIETSFNINPARIIVVVGFGKDQVIEHLSKYIGLEFVEQDKQLGTGHAVQMTYQKLKEFEGNILVLNGDVPLISSESLKSFLDYHNKSGCGATVMTAEYDNPEGYGRIIRNTEGRLERIVEQKDASIEELSVNEINTGIIVFKSEPLFKFIFNLRSDNAQRELYITDMIEILSKNNVVLEAWKNPNSQETYGVNRPEQLKTLEDIVSD